MEILLITSLKPGVEKNEGMRILEERAQQFRQVKGLIQKFYCEEPPNGDYAGVYIFDTNENLIQFLNSDLRKSLATAYKLTQPPKVLQLHVVKLLHETRTLLSQQEPHLR